MTMGEELPINYLVYPILLRPILDKLERKDTTAAEALKTSLSKVEHLNPGFAYDLVMGLLKRADLSVNMTESLLKLQGNIPETEEYKSTRSEDAFQELNKKAYSLKKILSRIPDEINDRKTFLETIKEIASAIKKLLDTVYEVTSFIHSASGRQALEQRKKEFVKCSKRFSNTLKDFFKEGQAQAVFVSALFLIHQTNVIMVTVKNKSDKY
ncbi:programmed cell death protein 10-like [Limulus polyphemus]|uniref:Programmed cell death protein 10-like n=1 Tax=Limulus polyphemus TaxID=6850 RepID=A0ABM1T6E4_LIMPO|nr:programmed cell death protein 10-like [Limulus polyphemus]XP_022251450.1 programmed cell death protein 10-like [Limulus polyphemus]XP_022251455.1 programmed cell death protein 10-like [Limulus polyphemus]XP_022251463.1 programmed cell death protein 10-like [Limulus polyphemus]